jgi:hypothetical protein
MTKEQLLIELKNLLNSNDAEQAHVLADRLLLEYINDTEITKAFQIIEKWYA